MATPAVAAPVHPTTPSTTNHAGGRGKHQIHWSEGVWKALDHAVLEEMRRTRVAAKFLPHVHVEKKQTNVASDIVIVPGLNSPITSPPTIPFDSALSVDESQTTRIQEYWVTFKMSVAQVEEEEHAEGAMGHHLQHAHPMEPAHHEGHGMAAHPHHHQMMNSHRASTGVSLAMRTADILAQAEDLVLLNGKNSFNSPLFKGLGGGPLVQFLDPNLVTNLDNGLLSIDNKGIIHLPSPAQVIPVHPVQPGSTTPPIYAENTLNAVASAFSVLQGLGHYEHYALALNTVPYADLHQALKTTLIEPVEPISHLVKAGIYGSGTLPPFDSNGAGLPQQIDISNDPNHPNPQPLKFSSAQGGAAAKILFTGVLVSLSGNTMDHVRGKMEDNLDVIVTFNQKDANEQYRFRVVERFCLRLKDPTAVCLLVFL